MKNYLGILLTFFVAVALISCANDKKISLPEANNVKEIEIVESNSQNTKKISDIEKISKIIESLNANSKSTNKESVNDQPTNVDDYTIIKFYHKISEDNPSVVYLYTKKGKSYLEQPYSGIWEFNNDVINEIVY